MPRKGYKQSLEHIAKCRAKKIGKLPPCSYKGFKWTAERRAKFVPPMLNVETRKKISAALKGRKLTIKQIEAISGKNNWQWKNGKRKNRTAYLESLAGRKKPKCCELCGRSGRICFDHDYKTGRFRGWLCVRCNSMAGRGDEKIEYLEKLIDYIKKR